MSVSWTIHTDTASSAVIDLSGAITEDTDLTGLLEIAKEKTLQLDLRGVTQINSCGVREWIYFVRGLSETGRPYSFVSCSPAIVRQLNMISNFAGDATIRSVMLPYYCDNCTHEESKELHLDAVDSPHIPVTLKCPVCDDELTFDDLVDTYLSFAETPSWARKAG